MVVKRLGQTLRRLFNGRQEPPQGDFQELKLKFREFKYLLRANNEVLALIAEVETADKPARWSGLHPRATSCFLQGLQDDPTGRLSEDRYPRLVPAFDLSPSQPTTCCPRRGRGTGAAPVGRGPRPEPRWAPRPPRPRTERPPGLRRLRHHHRLGFHAPRVWTGGRQAVMLLEEALT
ncbi:hypothetical protein DFAR_2250005 [Desulfarculales bacterium]